MPEEVRDAVVVIDPASLTVADMNAEAERLFRWPADRAVGRPTAEVIPSVDQAVRERREGIVRWRGWWLGESRLLDRRGELVVVNASCVTAKFRGGRPALVSIMRAVDEINRPQIAQKPVANLATVANWPRCGGAVRVQGWPTSMVALENIDIDRTIRENVALARLEADISEAELARRIGVSDFRTVRRYERGLRTPPHPILVKIAVALDKPVGWFYEPHQDAAA